MAWVEGEPLTWEQGLDALGTFELFANTQLTQPWPFPSWDVNAVLSDEKQRIKYNLTVVTDAIAGTIRVIAPEVIINGLRTTKNYVLNVIMVAPGNLQADDHHLAFLPVTIAPRPARRDS